MKLRPGRGAILALCAAMLAATTTLADDSTPAKPAVDDLAAKRAAVAEKIAKLNPPALDNGETKPLTPDVEEQLDLLRSLDLVYVERQATAEDAIVAQQEKKHLADEAEALRSLGLAEKKPYSFLLYEQLRDQLSAEEDRMATIDSDIASARQMLVTARETLEQCERERRAARDAASENKDPAEQPRLDFEAQLAELNSSIAAETVELERSQLALKQTRAELAEARRKFLTEKVGLIAKNVEYTEHDYRQRLAEYAQRSTDLRNHLKVVEKQLRADETAATTALAKLRAENASTTVIAAATEAYQTRRRAYCEQVALVQQRLGELERFSHFATCRYEMVNKTASKANLLEWREQLSEMLERLSATENALGLRRDEIRADMAALYARSDDATDGDEKLTPWFELQIAALRDLASACESGLMHLRSRHRALERFQTDLEATLNGTAGTNRLAVVQKWLAAAWNTKLATVNDEDITAGKILTALFYLFVGVIIARIASRLFAAEVLPRFGLNEGAIHAMSAILFYSLCVLFCFLTLELSHVPFASFTFLGGAVAIAVGFGSQNILNNFMSGLILLAEQPIRVGDVVEMEGTLGTVEHIGARSIRVRTISNYEMIVPNSRLLDEKVTNLTLSDARVRALISVTLNRTLPIEEVRRRLEKAASSHQEVLVDPAPIALLTNFTATEQSFELHFCIELTSLMEGRIIESQVRFEVSKALNESNPQVTGSLAAAAPMQPAVAGKLPAPSSIEPGEARKAG